MKPLYLGYFDNDKEILMFEKFSFSGVEINVQPPARGEIDWFSISVGETTISINIEKTTSDKTFNYVELGMSEDEVRKLSIAFYFRCSDGTQWERRIDGSLNSLNS